MNYGKELILDLHGCDPDLFTRKSIDLYFATVCDQINMERCRLCWWDDLYTPKAEKETEPHLIGTSAVQFIRTSNITIHTLDILERVYVNIFSCKNFNTYLVARITARWFGGKIVNKQIIQRK